MAKSLDIIDPKKDNQNQNEGAEMTAEDVGVEPKSQGGVFYLILGIIALVVATAAALYILYSDKGSSKDQNSASEATATASSSATVSATATTSLTPSSAASAQSATSAFQYTNEQIRIVNGNGIAGEAAKIKKILEDKGFKIASVANASKTYSSSIIYFKKGEEALANALKDAISAQYTATTEEAKTDVVGQFDAVIALGSK